MLQGKELTAALLAKLRASALSAEDVKQVGIKAYTAEQVAAKPTLAVRYPAAGFVIPYYDVNREYTEFFRFRYLEQPVRNGFSSLTVQKELRYTQPPEASPRIYFSPLYDWAELLKRKPEERAIFITEGELKASCACKLGFPTLALGGVWNFRSARANQPLIPDLKDLGLEGVTVGIVYDSDAVTNPEVLKAENALARELLKHAAYPVVLRVPALGKNKKTGLDDFLVAKGAAGFKQLIKKAEPWEPSRALHEFNEEYLFLLESATVLDLEKRLRWRAAEAVNIVLANRVHSAPETRKKEVVMVEKRTAVEWLKWPGRAELQTVTYRPGEPVIIEGGYNCWRGWGVGEAMVKRGNIDPWHELLDFVFQGHLPEHKKWFEQWLAYPLQHPGTKMFTATILWGQQGTGKTLIGHTMSRIYGENYTEVNENELHATHNEWAEYRQFALGDEITSGDKRGVADYLKGIITQKFLRINPKHIKPYTLPDCINWLFSSNHPDAFFLEQHDRRYFVIEIKSPPRPRDFYKTYDAWYRSDAGIGALFYHFLHLDLEGFHPMDPAPITSSKAEMIVDSRSDVATWCSTLRDDPDAILHMPGQPAIPWKLWNSKELYALYDPERRSRVTENGLGRELKRAGFRKVLDGAPVRVEIPGGSQLVKLWIVRDIERISKELKKPGSYAKMYQEERDGRALKLDDSK